ncbi:MAG: Ig-like domain-containing protein, partial [Thermoplasmata archaeon]
NCSEAGVYLNNTAQSVFTSVSFEYCSVLIEGGLNNTFDTHSFALCTVNGKPLYYLVGVNAGIIPSDAGEVILVRCMMMSGAGLNIDNGTVLIEMYNSTAAISDSSLVNSVCSSYLINSNLTLTNCSVYSTFEQAGRMAIFLRTGSSVHLKGAPVELQAIQIYDPASAVYIYNWTRFEVVNYRGLQPLQDASVTVRDRLSDVILAYLITQASGLTEYIVPICIQLNLTTTIYYAPFLVETSLSGFHTNISNITPQNNETCRLILYSSSPPSSWLAALPDYTSENSLNISYYAIWPGAEGGIELWYSINNGGWVLYTSPAGVFKFNSSPILFLNCTEDGVYRFVTVAETPMGVRESFNTTPVSVVFDRTPPAIYLALNSSSSPPFKGGESVVLDYSIADTNLPTVPYALLYYSPEGNTWQQVSGIVIINYSGRFEVQLPPGMNSDSFAFRLNVSDLLGNSNFTYTAPFIVDSTAPESPLNISLPTITNSSSITIRWTNPSDTTGIASVHYCIDTLPTETDFLSNTSGAHGILEIILSEGNHTVYLWLEDGVGNSNPASAVRINITADFSPPQIVSITPPAGSSLNYSKQAAVFTILFSEQMNTTSVLEALTVDGTGVLQGIWEGTSFSFEVDIQNRTSFTIVLSPLAMDLAGNHIAYFEAEYTISALSLLSRVNISVRSGFGNLPLEGANITILFTQNLTIASSSISSESGAMFILPPGNFTVQVSASRHNSVSKIFELNPSENISLVIVLDPLPSGTVEGQVVDKNGSAVTGASVKLINTRGVVAENTTDAEGRFSFEVAPGTYQILVNKSGYNSTTISNVRAEDKKITIVPSVVLEVSENASPNSTDNTGSRLWLFAIL